MDFASPHLSDEHLPSSFSPRLPSASSSSSTASTRPAAAPPTLYTPPSRSQPPATSGLTTDEENENDFDRMLRALRAGEGESDKGRMEEVRSGTGSVVESKSTPSLGLGPPPPISDRLPLRQTSLSPSLPLSGGLQPVTPALLLSRPHSVSPPRPSTNIFAIPVAPIQPIRQQSTAPVLSPSLAPLGPTAAPARAQTLPAFGTAKDITLEFDPFAPASTPATHKRSSVAPSSPRTPGDESSSSSDDDEFPHLSRRQNYTSPYPSGQPSPSSNWHRHHPSLPTNFNFVSPASSTGASTFQDLDPTLPRGSSPPPPPLPVNALPTRRLSRSASQPTGSNILSRPPVFKTFTPSLPPYEERPSSASQPLRTPPPSEEPRPTEPPSTTNGFRSQPIASRSTSLTMQLAQREALEERDQGVFVPPAEEEELVPDVGTSLHSETPVDDERREFLTRPLGLLALSQALSAANDEVDTLRSMVRDATGLVVDHAYLLSQSAEAAAAARGEQQSAQAASRVECDELTEREIDEMNGSQAREALKILAVTSVKSLAAISCVRSMHALVHSPPGSEAKPPSDEEVFTDENLAMLEGTMIAWGRMARKYQQAQAQTQNAGRQAARDRSSLPRPR